MRVLFANDGLTDAGGVQTYLRSVIGGLVARGHEAGFLHAGSAAADPGSLPYADGVRYFPAGDAGNAPRAVADAKAWGPDVCFSHNMAPLALERCLLAAFPVVKLMHGYFGTCVSGLKMFGFPVPTPCGRRFGAACLALYLPRRCGPVGLGKMISGYRWAKAQNELFGRYAALVVASEHMRREYVANGADPGKVHVVPLFADGVLPPDLPARSPAELSAQAGERPPRLLFLGRMTRLKGGDALVRAAAEARRRLGRPVELVMAGDGPQRQDWEALAKTLGVSADFPGWVTGESKARLIREADLLAVPSLWPEPFGLVGPEAGLLGLPAVAFDVGGVRQWLTDGVNGVLVPARPPGFRTLADGLVRVLSNPQTMAAMRLAAAEAAGRLSLQAHLDRLEVILTEASKAGSEAGAA